MKTADRYPSIEEEEEALRDKFAGQALQGLLAGQAAHDGRGNYRARNEIAEAAYTMADAMMTARGL